MNEQRNHGQKSVPEAVSRNGTEPRVKKMPCFDAALRELRVGGLVIKRFTQQSDAQELIVTAFQEEDWSPAIDDPLTGKAEQDPKQRLRRAVDNLNRRQRVPLLQFRVLYQGTGVAWEFRDGSDGRATIERR
ncbi:MAG TPA: hypothetical protein VH682_24080 [Gemmataceae bacterium]|jgi:hypothetical protein